MRYLAILAVAAAIAGLVWLAARSTDPTRGHLSLSLLDLSTGGTNGLSPRARRPVRCVLGVGQAVPAWGHVDHTSETPVALQMTGC